MHPSYNHREPSPHTVSELDSVRAQPCGVGARQQGTEQASVYWAHVEQLLAEDKAAAVLSPLSSLPAAPHCHKEKRKEKHKSQ